MQRHFGQIRTNEALETFTKLWYNENIKMEVSRMNNHEYACYEVKLNRIFNIQSKQNLIWLAVLFTLPILYTIFNIVNHTFDWKGLLIFCCGCLAIMIVKLLSNPKCLDVTPDTIKFQSRAGSFPHASRATFLSEEGIFRPNLPKLPLHLWRCRGILPSWR